MQTQEPELGRIWKFMWTRAAPGKLCIHKVPVDDSFYFFDKEKPTQSTMTPHLHLHINLIYNILALTQPSTARLIWSKFYNIVCNALSGFSHGEIQG